jgi:hypothetical protein
VFKIKKMKKYALTIVFMVTAVLFIYSNSIAQTLGSLQQTPVNKNSNLKAGTYNFTSFSNSYKAPDAKWLANNIGYANYPDAGLVSSSDPANNAIEIVAKRTNNSKYYIDKDTASKFYIVTASEDINYQKNGQWLSIDKRLIPVSKNIFEASHQQEPVGFDVNKKAAYIKTAAGIFYCNNWQLSGKNTNGEKLLAKADWSNFSAGDDGIKIIDIFPGIDAEMIVQKGAVKTNFIIKQNKFAGYRQLLLTDEFVGNEAGALVEIKFPGGQTKSSEQNGDVDLSINKKTIAHISKAVLFATNDIQYLDYKIDQNHLSIVLNADNLDQQLLKGEVIIDPLVSSTASLPVASITGSKNNGGPSFAGACVYSLTIATPAKATFTGMSVKFGMLSLPPAVNNQAFFFVTGTNCDGVIFHADSTDRAYDSSGTLITKAPDGTSGFAAIDILNCLPSPACVPQNVTFYLGFYNTVKNGPDGVCSNKYVQAYEPFELLIEGHTIEIQNVTASPATICLGTSSQLTGTAHYGVPPYPTYNWINGINNRNITVSPLATTTYSVAIVDQCNDTAKGSVTVNVVNPVTPAVTISTPAITVCDGYVTVFTANPTNGGDAPIYQWYNNGNPVGNNTNTYSTSSLVNGDKISCLLTSNYFCLTTNTANSDTLAMTVLPSITPTANITVSDNNFCFGKSVIFTAHTTNVGAASSYHWQINGNTVDNNDSLFTTSTLNNNDMITCIVTVSATGCYTSQTITSNPITAVVYAIPVITFSPDSMILARYDTAKINSIVTGSAKSFIWTPTVGLIDPESITPIADPVISTVYQLSVTSANDCKGAGNITILVYDKIFMPSAFAPAGKNNIFRVPPGITFSLDNFSIYNRWGNKVFMTTDISKGWDGTVEGVNAERGVYVYVISGSDPHGKVFVKGTVTLLR